MLESAQLIYVCDHIIQNSDSIFVVDEIQRSNTETYDVICPRSIISDIQSIFSVDDTGKHTYYYENSNFVKLGSNLISWLSGGKQPATGSYYSIEYLKVTRTTEQYTQENCPRCNGNGWYVDITNQSALSMGTVTGVDKITQDFIKMLLTKSSDGTPDLFYYISRSDYNDTAEGIATFVKKCETNYMTRQSNLVSSGAITNPNEMLSSIIISNVEYDSTLLAYFISVNLVTADGNTTGISLKI